MKNRVFRPFHTRLDERMLPFKRLLPPWVTPEMPATPRLSDAELADLVDHPLVAIKTSETAPHVGSFNFTRDAFFQGAWDEVNIRARGLFVNTDTGEVVARSYDKFFNVGERPETRPEALAESLVFPVTLWLKENGYLGILGYDSATDDLFWTSKSTPDSEFAGWFRELGHTAMSEAILDALRRYLRDTHSALVFEVVDPVRDPHIIAYDEPALYLLECVHRGPGFRVLPHEKLAKLADFLGVQVKRKAMTFDGWAGLSRWMEVATQPGWQYQGRYVEGFVLEDAAGFLTKLKLDYYNFWKRLRSLTDRVRKIRGTNRSLGRDLSDPRVRRFHDWLVQQPDGLLEADIITVRRAWESGELPDGLDPLVPTPPTEDDRATRAFRGKIRSLADKPAGYTIPTTTADTIVAECLEDDRKLALLADSDVRTAIVLAATPGGDRDELAQRVNVDIA